MDINLTLDPEKYPMLFKLNPEDIQDTIKTILETGYNIHFPKVNNNQEVINRIEAHADLNDKMDFMSSVMEDLFGISKNSAKKGQIAEDTIKKIIQDKFKDHTVEDCRHKPHHGDLIIHTPDKKTVMVEIKNYGRPVDKDEISKLKYDMEFTGINFSMIMSLKSNFSGRKRLDIERFNKNGKNYYILFIPKVMEEVSKIESGLIVLERLIDMEENMNNDKITLTKLNHLYDSIIGYLEQLDSLQYQFSMLKANYRKMEDSIRNGLTEHYNTIRDFENDMRSKLKKIWDSINTDFDKLHNEIKKVEKCKTGKFLDPILKMVEKYEYDKIVYKNCVHLTKNSDIEGIITWNKNNITVFLEKTDTEIQLKRVGGMKQQLIGLDNILKSI